MVNEMEKGPYKDDCSEKCEPATQKLSDFKQLEETVNKTIDIAIKVRMSIKDTLNTINSIDECKEVCEGVVKEPKNRILTLEDKIKDIKQILTEIEYINVDIKKLFE